MTDEEKREARNARRRELYKINYDTIRAKARVRHSARKDKAETDKKHERRLQFSVDERRLIERVELCLSLLSGRHAAIADHIVRTVGYGMPYRGWQNDAHDALSISQ